MYSTGHIDKKEVDLSKPTGEWTPDYVIEMTCRNNFSRVIADAHNVALAAEREKVENLHKILSYRWMSDEEIAEAQQPLIDALIKAKPFIRALPGKIDEAKAVMSEVNAALAKVKEKS